MSNSTTETGASGAPADAPGPRALPAHHRPAHHALLFSRKPLTEPVRFLSADPEPFDIRLDAVGLAGDSDVGLVVLEVQPLHMIPLATPLELGVVRGRRGGKSPEALYLLQPAHRRKADMRAPERSGFGKAVLRALALLCPQGTVSLPLAWLAVELAARGYCSRSDLARTCRRISHPLPDTPPGTLQCPGFIVLTEWADRMANQAREILAKAAGRNPLFTRLDTCHLMAWCGGCERAVATVVMNRYALLHGLQVQPDCMGEAVVHREELKQCSEPERLAADSLQERFSSGHGVKRDALMRELPNQRNLVAWMFDAHELVEATDGFVLSRQSLVAAYQKLGLRLGTTSLPGTGQLKTQLGWSRQLAEGYRSLLEHGLRQADSAERDLRPQTEHRYPPRPPRAPARRPHDR